MWLYTYLAYRASQTGWGGILGKDHAPWEASRCHQRSAGAEPALSPAHTHRHTLNTEEEHITTLHKGITVYAVTSVYYKPPADTASA